MDLYIHRALYVYKVNKVIDLLYLKQKLVYLYMNNKKQKP